MSKHVHLFVSPHLDDVALSCGGYVRYLTRAGELVIVLTVFAADLPAGTALSWLARRNQTAWRLGDAPFAARRDEDAAAMQLLGAQFRHLNFLDAIYRRDFAGRYLYMGRSVGVSVHPDDRQNCEPRVRHEVEQVLQTYKSQDVHLYVPLGAGGHVDHLLVRHAGELAHESGVIAYYEDFPYADQPDALQSQLHRNGNGATWQASLVALTPDEIDARVGAVACYVSQVPGLFPSPLERAQEIVRTRAPLIGRYIDGRVNMDASRKRMTVALQSYIARVGGERFWQSGLSAPKKRQQIS